jgi:hypothetical protein
MSEEKFLLPHSEYSECKDAGICGRPIPEEILGKYQGNEPALTAITEAHEGGKKSIRRSHFNKRRYGRKMNKK